MDEALYEAAGDGEEAEVEQILRTHRNVSLTWGDEHRSTALHEACSYGHDPVVALLLAHPRIEVNRKDRDEETPFYVACYNGRLSCARLLMLDPRVENLNEPNGSGYTPLRWAAARGDIEMIRWMIASGKPLELGQPGNEFSDAIGVARKNGNAGVILLLEGLKENPARVRYQVWMELGLLDQVATEVSAIVAFVTAGFLKCKATNVKPGARRTRFLSIASRLPPHIQGALCLRMMGSPKRAIRDDDREVACKTLAKALRGSEDATRGLRWLFRKAVSLF